MLVIAGLKQSETKKLTRFVRRKLPQFYNDSLTQVLIAICKFKTACYFWMKGM